MATTRDSTEFHGEACDACGSVAYVHFASTARRGICEGSRERVFGRLGR